MTRNERQRELLQTLNGADITPGSVGQDYVTDSTGRYLGQLTGTNDAQVVIDAIADRAAGASITIPNPGTALDWEQQVDLPNEEGFSLATAGLPVIETQSGYSDTHAINKPSTGERNYGLRLGSFYIKDTAQVLDPAVSIKDVKESVLYPTLVEDAPALELLSNAGTFTNQNKAWGWFCKSDLDGRQAAYYCGGTDGSADQNWFTDFHFVPANASQSNPVSIAVEDHGAFNDWVRLRCESADTVAIFDDAREYFISSGGWDRTQTFRRTVEERNGARGEIVLRNRATFEALDLISPATTVRCRAKHYDRPSPRPAPMDAFENTQNRLGGQTLADIGWSTQNMDVTGVDFTRPKIDFLAPGSGTAYVRTPGNDSKMPQATPKYMGTFGPETTGGGTDDDDDVLARVGWTSDPTASTPTDRAELIYDPTDSLAEAPTPSNWYLVVDNGGTTTTVDTGVSEPAATDNLNQTQVSLNAISTGTAGPGDLVTATVAETRVQIEDMPTGQLRWHWKVTATTASAKTWKIDTLQDTRLYR